VDSRVVSRQLYESYFHELNLAIKTPKKDTCYICDKFQTIVSLTEEESKVRFEKNLTTHHDLADIAYLSKAREAAAKDESKVTQIINLICEEFPKTVFCFLKTCLLGLIPLYPGTGKIMVLLIIHCSPASCHFIHLRSKYSPKLSVL
jgi:hypothetical protein